jgi:hypothetical protein
MPQAAWSLRPPATEADTVCAGSRRARAPTRRTWPRRRRARRRIVYVSCDPQTLGRDARLAARGRFELTGAVALDLMPQTYHVEVVREFSNRAGAK